MRHTWAVPAYSLKPGLQFLIVYMRGHCPDAAYLTYIPDVCPTSSYGVHHLLTCTRRVASYGAHVVSAALVAGLSFCRAHCRRARRAGPPTPTPASRARESGNATDFSISRSGSFHTARLPENFILSLERASESFEAAAHTRYSRYYD